MSRNVYNIGSDSGEKTSVRVNNPAGGRSTISLAWDTDSQPQPSSYNGKKYRNESNNIFGNSEPTYEADRRKKNMYEPQVKGYGSQIQGYEPQNKGYDSLSKGYEPSTKGYDHLTKGCDPQIRSYEPPIRSYEPQQMQSFGTRARSYGREIANQQPEKTSVKVTYAPGGGSTLVLGGDEPTNYYRSSDISGGNQGYSKQAPTRYEPVSYPPKYPNKKAEPTYEKIGSRSYNNQDNYSYGTKNSPSYQFQESTDNSTKTSVRVNNPPGGKSTFSFY
mmetsp:Transcript_76556/g.88971  ORF Transcript_76556/g.88971 Transcript_76556/m.88971 type:complete len:275 (-) Transcript_76556:63-887(-)